MDQRTFVPFTWAGESREERIEGDEVVPPGRAILERVRLGLVERGLVPSEVAQHASYGWYIDTESSRVQPNPLVHKIRVSAEERCQWRLVASRPAAADRRRMNCQHPVLTGRPLSRDVRRRKSPMRV